VVVDDDELPRDDVDDVLPREEVFVVAGVGLDGDGVGAGEGVGVGLVCGAGAGVGGDGVGVVCVDGTAGVLLGLSPLLLQGFWSGETIIIGIETGTLGA
jgi:hypothetical protein